MSDSDEQGEDLPAADAARLKSDFEAMSDDALGMNHPANIIVSGFTGAGKSTLINAMFGDDFCQTGIGRPVTQGVQRLSHPDKPVVLYDTKGLEIENSQQTTKNLEEEITKQRSSPRASDQPHVMWVCVNTESSRFEDAHEGLINMAKRQRVPPIVVLTQDYFSDSDELAATIRSTVGDSVPVIAVVADAYTLGSGKVIVRRGLDKLLHATYDLMPEAARAALEFAQVVDMRMKMQQVTDIVNRSALIAGASAFPASFVPGSHSAFLIALEAYMLRAINKTMGLTMSAKADRAIAIGMTGVALAASGGPLLATQLAALIPGVGQISAATAGGTAAAGIVKLLGSAYGAIISELVERGDLSPEVDSIIAMAKAYIPGMTAHSGRPGRNRP